MVVLLHETPIVLVHGLFGNLKNHEILAPFGGAEIHTPDLIGYGRYRHVSVDNLALTDQAKHLAQYIGSIGKKAHLVGHSVGGAVSALVCKLYPELVASFVCVEGNFTLKDAFWSGQIALKSDTEVAEIIQGYQTDATSWIAAAGVPITAWTVALAEEWLANQPPSTIKAQAKAVVAETKQEGYLSSIRAVMQSETPVYLISGARSAKNWDVPDWINSQCRMRINIPNTGHLMMAESPALFAQSVLACVSFR